jgi:hypothetical protein
MQDERIDTRLLEGSRFGAYPRDLALFLSARVQTTNLLKRAAPANDSTRGLSLGARINHSNRRLVKTSPWVATGSRLFNPISRPSPPW